MPISMPTIAPIMRINTPTMPLITPIPIPKIMLIIMPNYYKYINAYYFAYHYAYYYAYGAYYHAYCYAYSSFYYAYYYANIHIVTHSIKPIIMRIITHIMQTLTIIFAYDYAS